MKNLLNFFIVPVVLFFSFQKNSMLRYSGEKASGAEIRKEGKIVYLFFKADKEASGKERIVLQEKKVAEGKLKSAPSFDRSDVETGDFMVILSDSGGKEVIRQLVKNPLHPEMEVYEKEGISRKKIPLENAEFSVRYAYSEQIQTVKIEKVTESGTQLLFTQKL
ncbi:hypothetical protein [Chryseobacterium vrystaatense]|uniref:Uncharacterized protein n=1 Tax=Chryseobacterium vrystaatense TaxID=307480 RepID=A0A1M5LQN5_9FLAO|nr:hypothetical protein [Chryseobacterium vrystaatense]SHG67434.1 hypothetical protein SAMN02787073_4627 [Chryseobacterium vrystaatense]